MTTYTEQTATTLSYSEETATTLTYAEKTSDVTTPSFWSDHTLGLDWGEGLYGAIIYDTG